MMRVTVEYLGFVRILLGKRGETFELEDGAPLAQLLSRIASTYGEAFMKEVYEPGMKDLKPGFVASVNGILTGQLRGLETRLKDGDHVILMPFASGG